MGMTHTLSGNVLSFQTAEESNITSLKCNFSCNPNYHGFNSVWPGGAGKNKLGFKIASGVADGTNRVIDFTENYIKITATRTVNGNAIIGYPTAGTYCRNNTIPAGTYTFSVQDFSSNIPDFSKSNIRCIYDANVILDGETATFTEATDFMYIGYNTSFSWPEGAYIMFKLQLEEGSSVTSWEPYENIATITGHNQIEIQHYGNNICNYDKLEWYNGYRNDNGVYNTSTNSHMILTPINVKPLTVYYLKIASSHTNTRIYYLTKDEQWINRSWGSSGNNTIWFRTPENCYKIQMQFYNSDDVSSIHLQEARRMPEYEAYHENKYFVNFPAVGKNLLDEQTYGIPYDTSMCFGRTSHTYADNMFLKAGTYTVSSDLTADMIVVTNSAGRQLNGVAMNTTYHTFTLTEDGNVGILFYKTSLTANEFLSYHYQLEIGDTATSYEPFNNTIYGGYIDLATGELVQTHAKFIENGSENVNVWEQTVRTNFIAYTRTDLSTLGILQPYIGYKTAMFNYCTSPLTGGVWEGAMGTGGANSANHNNNLRLLVPTSFSTISSLLAYFSEHPLEVIYELQTPIHYQLTPQQLQTYIESNYFYSDDADTIECTYEFDESADILATRKRIIASTPHIETISDSFISFNTDLNAQAKDVKIYFNPIQSGEGDPGPSNIRNLVAWSNIKLRFLNDYLPIIPNNPQQIYYSNDNKYRMEYTTNGKFKLLDTIAAGDYPTFDINIVPTIYPEDGNRILAISDIKTSIGAWNLTFSLRDSDNAHKMNGYFEFGSTAQALCVVINDTSTIRDITYTLIKLIFSNAIPKDTEFILGITNSSNIISQDINFSSTPIYGGYVDLTEKQIYSNYYQLSTSNLTSDIVHKVSRFTDYDAYYFGITNLDVIPASDLEVPNMFFEDYKTVSWDERMNNPKPGIAAAVAVSGGTRIQIFTEKDAYETVEDFITSLANRVILFKRLSPLSYPIESQPLNIYKGTNNIWSSANGPVSIKYWTH